MSPKNTNTQSPSPFRVGASKFDSARLLYMAGDTTQKSIAAQVGVSERTMHSWIKDNGWDRLRHASRTAPAIIAENMFSQIVELQNDIASREEGKRYPTMQEAELTRKLCLSIDKMKNAHALSQTMQVLRLFRSFANGYGDRDFRLTLNRVIEHFLEGEAKNGYFPYQIEYGSIEPAEETHDNGSTHGASPAPTYDEHTEPVENREDQLTHKTRNKTEPEITDQKTPPSPSERARGEVFSPLTTTSDTRNDPQKPEVKRKFSHSMLNRIASPGR